MPLSFGSLYHLAVNGMKSRQLDLDAISNNLANIHTSGYKASRVNFQELLNENEISGTTPVCTQVGTGQGSLQITGNPLDWAIDGPGFFAIKLPDGTKGYTRDGSFSLDKNGKIVTSAGYELDWSGTIPADADQIKVDVDGTVSARVEGVWDKAGNVQLAIFTNPTGLESAGGNIWKESDSSGKATMGDPGEENYGLIQGSCIEASTVNITDEISHMIRTQRSFQAAARALTTTDEMVAQAINMRQG
ncbi:MAG: flagellar hook-basal body complex protein [Leptolinea sp.]|jgi:flagellar basal-body rod protein FlgG|nr:flagellar hook-basal body complex protein [Leptolinea sp.]